MYPPVMSRGALRLPVAAPVPVLAASVTPRASRSFCHVAGAVLGGLTAYSDLNACAWYQSGGRELRGPRRAFGVAGLKGGEDGKQRKQ